MTVKIVLEVVAVSLVIVAVALFCLAWRKAGELLRDMDRQDRR